MFRTALQMPLNAGRPAGFSKPGRSELPPRPTGFGKPSRSGDTPKDVTANAVKKASIIFTPGKRRKETINNAGKFLRKNKKIVCGIKKCCIFVGSISQEIKKQASRAFLGIRPVFLLNSRYAILNFLFVFPHTYYQFCLFPLHHNHLCIFRLIFVLFRLFVACNSRFLQDICQLKHCHS